MFFAALCIGVVTTLVTAPLEWDPFRFSQNPARVVGELFGPVLGIFAISALVGAIVCFIRRRSNDPWKGALAAVITGAIIESLAVVGHIN